MIRPATASALFCAMLLSAKANAQDSAIADVPAVEAAVRALEAGDTVAASRLITSVEQVGFGETFVWTPIQAMSLLADCKSDELGRVRYDTLPVFVYEWDCGRNKYSGAIAPLADPRMVFLIGITEGRGAEFMLTPPQQPMVSINRDTDTYRAASERLDRIELAHAKVVAQMLFDGELEALSQLANQYSRSSFARYDTELAQGFVQLAGPDSPALLEILQQIEAVLGMPTAFDCATVTSKTRCTWTMADSGTTLAAWVGTGLGEQLMITSIDFEYTAADTQ